MIVRRKVLLASLTGALVPLFALRAQPGPPPDDGRDHGRRGYDEDHRGPYVQDDRRGYDAPPPRPHMPPPRHEDRPPPPDREGWRWRPGHWAWAGNRWRWSDGRWYR